VASVAAGFSHSQAAERPKRVKPQAVTDQAPPAAAATPAAVPAVLSIIPAQAEPGSKVMMFGSGFGTQSSAFLGSMEITSKVTDGKQLEFIIPQQLDSGMYALYIKRSDGSVSRPYNFIVMPVRPVLEGLVPEQISSCSQGREREVTARGQNFIEKSQLLFDGSVLKSSFVSSEAITFAVPNVAGGLHQIVVKNNPDNGTVPVGLIIETKPEIAQVTTGSEYVNYYELHITGKNFQQNSAIFVDGMRVGGRGGDLNGERDKLIYVDCTRLIYQRYPYTQVNKDFRILVMNPGGEASQAVNITAP
jgi:hypothetical protein